MDKPDLKKLITGFLILAIVTSSGALAFSTYLSAKANRLQYLPEEKSKNIFSKNKPEDLNNLPQINPSNYTDGLAEDIAQGILEKNPSGPTEINGENGLDLPENLDSLVKNYIQGVSSPEINYQASLEKIKVKENYSSEDLVKYMTGITEILSALDGPEIKNIQKKLSESPDEALLGATKIFFMEIVNDLYQLEVPGLALEFHKDLISLFNLQAERFKHLNSSDPLLALMILNEDTAEEELEAELLKEINLLKVNFPEIKTDGAFSPFINTAYAGWPVFDWFNGVLNTVRNYIQNNQWLKELREEAMAIYNEYLKDVLIQLIVAKIVGWIKGTDGNPNFILNWQDYLENVFAAEAGYLLYKTSGFFCSDFREVLTNQSMQYLGAKMPGGTGGAFTAGCPLEELVDPTEFYGNFYTGGWDAFTRLSLPSSNYYGSRLMTFEIEEKARKAEEAAKLKGLAGGGVTGMEECETGKAVGGKCSDGGRAQISTPGVIMNQVVSQALSAPLQRIITAKDSNTLKAALKQYIIDEVILKGLLKSKVGAKATGKNEYSTCDTFPSGSQDQKDCIANVNDIKKNDKNSSFAVKEAEEMLSDSKSTLESVIISLDTVSSSISVLKEVVANESLCAEEATTAKQELLIMEDEYAKLSTQAEKLLSRISALESFLKQSGEELDRVNALAEIVSRAETAQEMMKAIEKNPYLKDKLEQISELLKQCLAP